MTLRLSEVLARRGYRPRRHRGCASYRCDLDILDAFGPIAEGDPLKDPPLDVVERKEAGLKKHLDE